MEKQQTILLANKMEIPTSCRVILWDMDGVLIDSLGLDLVVVNQLLKKYFNSKIALTRKYIQSIFAFSVPDFWRMILEKIEKDFLVDDALRQYDAILQEYENVRQAFPYELCPGVREALSAARSARLQQAVVSNNPTAQVREILQTAGIEEEFDLIVGNDVSVAQKTLKKKPAPDTYLFTAQQLNTPPNQCVVVEDSLIGIEAGNAAGCFVVGVATGGATFQQLQQMKSIDRMYQSFS